MAQFMRHNHLIRRAYLVLERDFLRETRLLSNPLVVQLGTTYHCKLRCPLCPTGRRSIGGKDLTFNDAQFIISRLKGVHGVRLFGWGESFLTRDIFKIITLLRQKHIHIGIDSNLNIKDRDTIERIAKSKIDLLSVSLDGADQESYGAYRRGGSFDLAFRNMAYLWNARYGPRKMQWQYIISRKNIRQVERARVMAKEIGIPIIFIDIGLYLEMFYNSSAALKEEWWTDEQRARLDGPTSAVRGRACMYMYNEPFIDTNMLVYPCCHAPLAPQSLLDEGYENIFGDLRERTMEEIWNNDYYQTMRSRFGGRPGVGLPVKPICLKCGNYLKFADPGYFKGMPVFDLEKPTKSHDVGSRAFG